MKGLHSAALLAALLSLPAAGYAQTAALTGATVSGGSPALSQIDRQFVNKAAAAGLAEVEAGQLALQKASSPGVRQFAQSIVDDHTQANEQLKTIASQKNLALPDAPDASERRKMSRLQNLSGPAFDRAFLKNEHADHKEAITLFSRQSRSGTDPELQKFATETLPKLQEHLQHVEALQKAEVGGSK